MRKITKLMLTLALLVAGVGVNTVKAQGGTKTPLLLLKGGAINTTDFDVTPINPSTLTTDNLYAATFTSTNGNPSNTFQYKNLDVKDYDKAVVKYTIEAENGDWQINLPSGSFTALPIGTDQEYEVDLTGVDTYGDFTVFSWFHTGKSITISEVYLYKADSSKKLPVDLSTLPATSENTTWEWDGETSTGTFAWSQTSYNSTELFGSGNYSGYTTLNLVTTTGTADHFRIILKFTNGAGQVTIGPIATGTVSLNLSDYTTVENLANVSTIRLSGANDCTGNITVSDVYFEGPDIVYIEASEALEAPAGTTDVKNLTGTNADWANTVVYPKEFAVQGQSFGDGNGDKESTHVDIDGYDYICFNVTTATDNSAGLRVWIWDDATSSVKTLYAYPIADYKTADFEAAVKITGVGTYVAKVSGYKYLKGVKAANDWGAPAAVVSMAYMCKGNPVEYKSTGLYTLVGEATGSASLEAALNDDDATCYDATGVTGTNVDLTSVANPNALFIAKGADVLANTENVIVNDVCDDLFLTDGFAFKAPADFTAAHVTYKRALAGKTVTVCLPFALNSDQIANIGTFYALSNFDGSTLQFTSVDATEANTPYVVVASSYSLGLDGADVAVPATPASLAASASDVEFIGTMADATVPASDVTYSYYAYNNGEFVKVVDAAATLPAFRGYFKVANGGAGSRALNVSFEDAATGIETLSTVVNETKSNTIFDLSGRRVNAAQKGVYIVNGKKVIK